MSSRRYFTIKALASLLEGITVANGFSTDAGQMVRLGQELELGENDPDAAILIISGIEKFKPSQQKLYSEWPLSIRAVVKVTDDNIDQAWITAELAVADIERAIEVQDRTLGELINDNQRGLVLDSIQTAEREAGSSVVGIDLVFIASLARTWGDPLGTAQELVLV